MMKSRVLGIVVMGCLIAGVLSALPDKTVQGLIGDLDISGLVDQTDLAVLDQAYGTNNVTTPIPANWDERADIDLDGYVNLKDLTYAGRNYGEPFNFHWPRRVSNGRINNDPKLTNSVENASAVDADGNIHIIWVESTTSQEPLFYEKTDPGGNPLVEDIQVSNDSSNVSITTDHEGNAHIVYFRRFSSGGGYYTRFDADGKTTIAPYRFCASCDYADLAVDEYTNAHLVFNRSDYELDYAVIGPDGNPLMPQAPINAATQAGTRTADHPVIVIDTQGNRHIFWHQFTGVDGGDFRYSRITPDGTFTANQVLIKHVVMSSSYNARSLDLAVDSHGSAHFMYHTGTVLGSIYWRRMDTNGTLSAEKLVTTNAYNENPLAVHFVVDGSDRIHYLAAYTNGNGEIGYGLLDRDGNSLEAFQRVAFDGQKGAEISVSAQGNGAIISGSEKQDALKGRPLLVMTTLADASANDRTRADLEVDAGHLTLAKTMLKITETADMTLTIYNGGWQTATGNTITYRYPDETGAYRTISAPLVDLPASQYTTVHQLIDAPDLEDTDLWEVEITVGSTTAETSLANNTVTASFGIFPPPRSFNIEAAPFDETYAPDDRGLAAPFAGAVLTLTNPALGVSQVIDPTREFNIFWDVPLDMNPAKAPNYSTTYTLALTAPGFSTDTLEITAQRSSAADPYTIVYSTPMPARQYINRWGTLNVQVSGGGSALQGARITLDNGWVFTTNSLGAISDDKIPSGARTLTLWGLGYEPQVDVPFTITQGHTTSLNPVMQPTTRAEVSGIVRNEVGEPLDGAVVTLRADPDYHTAATTGADGNYHLSVAVFSDYTNYRIEATRTNYIDYSAALTHLAPGWPDQEDLIMELPVTAGALRHSGSINSWGQKETWCKASEDNLQWREWLREKIGSKWCPDYEVDVDWGKYDYTLALDYEESAGGVTIHSLDVRFENEPFTSYEVSSGRYSGGGESTTHTGERIDWVELVTLDSAGNAVGDPIWRDDGVWYSTWTDGPAAHRQVDIEAEVASLDNLGLRVFYTVGSYASGENNNWADWDPPADLTMGSGSGRPSGADRQVFTWWLESDTLEHRYAFADYRSFLSMQTDPAFSAFDQAPLPAFTQDTGTLSLTYPQAQPARVGSPWVVEIDLSGAESKPIYGIEFSLHFDPQYLRLVSVNGAPAFAGPFGTFSRSLDLPAINQSGDLTDAAVVRLGAADGLPSGKLVQVVFLPLRTTPSTRLDLKDIYLTDVDSSQFRAVSTLDNTLRIENASVYLPMVIR